MKITAISGFFSREHNRIIEKGEAATFDDKRAQELIRKGLAIAGPDAPEKKTRKKK